MKSLLQEAFDDLDSQKCKCGADKERRKSLCVKCYYSLPNNLRKALYNTVSDGYA